MSLVEEYVDSNVSVITLNNSEDGNRLNNESLMALSRSFNSALMNDKVRVIALRSNGDKFCLGMDLNYLQSVETDDPEARMVVSMYGDLLLKIYEAPKPVVCLLNGEVKAGGTGLVAACDIILSSEKTTFELSEGYFGLIPANVLPFIFGLRLSPQKTRYLILTAKKIDAHEAHRLNMIDEVYPIDEMEKRVRAVIKNLMRISPLSIKETKDFTHKILSKDLDESCSMAKEKLLELIENPEVIDAISAFNEGQTPKWFGKYKPENLLVL